MLLASGFKVSAKAVPSSGTTLNGSDRTDPGCGKMQIASEEKRQEAERERVKASQRTDERNGK